MPNVKSAKKRLRTNARDTQRNRVIRGAFRTALKQANTDIESGNAESAVQSVGKALHEIGRSASKGIIHKNKAARQQSRLVKKARKAGVEVG